MSTYSDFYDGVIPDVPGVTTSVAENLVPLKIQL